jgi:hypothetical protein
MVLTDMCLCAACLLTFIETYLGYALLHFVEGCCELDESFQLANVHVKDFVN